MNKIKVHTVITALTLLLFSSPDICNEKMKKSAIIIVGTGRCGSSCVAGVLDIMGVEFGNNLATADQYNPKVYVDDRNRFNDSIYLGDEFNINMWISPKIIKWDQVPNMEALKNRVKEYLKEHFSQYPIFAVKNSHLSLLIPIYAQAVMELGYTPKILVAGRDPHEVVHSWKNRPGHAGATIAQLYAMTSICFMTILEHSINYDTLVIDFNDLINNTPVAVNKLYNFIPGLKSYELVQEEIQSFVDKNLKNF